MKMKIAILVVELGVLVVLVQDLETKVVDPFADEKTRRERERQTRNLLLLSKEDKYFEGRSLKQQEI